ncbi:class I SAM-dependent methyltransferase [Carboxylicivirga sediminis]|uniref:Class I SAM-dependent methyltransferase n=1 Tax=Carboxylicivirga sediminis TaxID=2006564 RepID=A0A941F1C4_9BACT|nr:class I SAM-dependent methyltransferase [Carboxylicivirga sediminis]MBR8534244.1 class I SAM-dependent methyltransferase [Carboxylicivirga sediminis]
MVFYSELVEAYDAVFPLNPKQLEFVQKACDGSLASKSVLDMGCGTGSLSIAMARQSAKVRAFDFDAEMVGKAEEKRPQALDLQFQQGDMRLVDTYFIPMLFDAVLCFGNTLVHLDTANEVELTIGKAAGRLKAGGKLMLQIVNYDRVLNEQVTSLPTISTSDYSFVRHYKHLPDGKIDFSTVLHTPTAKVENSVPLLALRKEQLEAILNTYFSDIKCFGGFDRSQWSPTTFHLVVEAIK